MNASQLSEATSERAVDVFIARQPIFDRKMQVYGFELLYRGSSDNAFDNTPAEVASARVIANTFLTMGSEKLLCGKVPFINFDTKLLREYAPVLPFPHAVVEILETVEPTDEILAACRDLKKRGYQVALDDCAGPTRVEPWIGTLDIVKVDFLVTTTETREDITRICKQNNIRPLAEKLESREEFTRAWKMGYEYFQGFFFAEPTVIRGRAISDAQLLLLQLLKEVSAEDVDFDKVEQIVRRNVSFVHKLLRFMNSPLFGWQAQIKSVKHALTLLGEEELRKWIALLLVADLGAQANPQLVIDSLVRARFAELLSPKAHLGAKKSSAFLLGLLSHLDALLQRPMAEVVAELKLDAELAAALVGRRDWKNDLGMLYEMICAYEKPDWVRTAAMAQDFNVSVLDLSTAYVKAVEWADKTAKV